jgi:asparagine synthase (glutamine-hydrolysing)
MGGFHLVRDDRAGAGSATGERLRGSFARQGFGAPKVLRAGAVSVSVYPKLCGEGDNFVIRDNGDFCTAVGTLLYGNATGASALERLLSDFKSGTIRRASLHGHYCVLIGTGEAVEVFTDPIGTYPVWRDAGTEVLSSSFLAIADAIDGVTVDAQAAYEYVFQGSTYGGASVFREIELFDCHTILRLGPGVETRPWGPAPAAAEPGLSEDDHLARNLANLRAYYDAITACFGDRIDTALSGGYDSRLTLALLLERGVSPSIHVYGRPTDADVTVAKHVAAGEGFELSHVDKSAFAALEPDAFPEAVERNFLAFHGHPADGLFENGSDLATRTALSRGGRLMLNGGGGEVFRNFFYLPDRPFSVRQILWSFYSRFDPATCTRLFEPERYYRALEDKVRKTLGVVGERLSRRDVERVYPEFRCRFWMGRNNSVNNRLGAALTPFIDENVVPDALGLPLRIKNFGRFEARLIRAINPRLAAYQTVYGHGFAGEPPLRRILKDLRTYARPPVLRRFTYRWKHRRPGVRPYWLGDDYVGRVLDLDFPYARRLFQVTRVCDNEQYNRICTLELLFERYQPAFSDHDAGPA